MKLRKVKPSSIKVPEVRVTARFDEETRNLLRNSVKEAGLIAPIIVQEIDGDLILVDGLHRLEDCLSLGDQPIDVAVLEGDMADLLCRNLFLDKIRGKPPVGDMVKVIGALFSEYGFESDKIKEKTGLPREYIEKLVQISGAIPEVVDAVDQELIGIGKAFQISRLPSPLQQEKVLAISIQYGKRLPEADLRAQVDAILVEMANLPPQPVAPPKPAEPRVYLCEGCKGEVDPRYLRPAMLCPNCFGSVWELSKVHDNKAGEIPED